MLLMIWLFLMNIKLIINPSELLISLFVVVVAWLFLTNLKTNYITGAKGSLAERLTVLSYPYLFLDILSVIVIIFRNLLG
jgi:hypothetical protein